MKVFKVIYARNEVVSCKESPIRLPDDLEIRYEQNNGQLIYAFVQANDMADAISKVGALVPNKSEQLPKPPSGDPSSSPG
jgi:hypothetical protein